MGSKSKRNSILIVCGVLASAVLGAIGWLRLTSMQKALGGPALPDQLPTGYDLAYVERVQADMTGELYESYAAVHYVWDILFPLAVAATLMLLIIQITGGGAKLLFLLVPLIYAVVDIAENFLIEAMFAMDSISEGFVALTSTFTVLKFILFAACLLVALLTLLTRPRPATSR